MKKILPLLWVFGLFALAVQAQSEATYSVTFTSNWTQAAHPHSSGSLPGNAHWSKLVGAVHNDQVVFLEMGEIATPGVEDIAELGSNGVFFTEVNTAVGNSEALAIVDGPNLSTAEGEIVISSITATTNYPLLTLLSMIAPSPDWMIAVNGVSLVDGNGDWINEIVLDLYPYDAGTDSGSDYSSPNMDTNPQDPISSLQGVTPFSNEIIGTLTITLTGVLGVDQQDLSSFVVAPNPATNQVTVSSGVQLNRISIFNALGTQVKSYTNLSGTEQALTVGDLPSGIYLVQVEDHSNRTAVKRLVIR